MLWFQSRIGVMLLLLLSSSLIAFVHQRCQIHICIRSCSTWHPIICNLRCLTVCVIHGFVLTKITSLTTDPLHVSSLVTLSLKVPFCVLIPLLVDYMSLVTFRLLKNNFPSKSFHLKLQNISGLLHWDAGSLYSHLDTITLATICIRAPTFGSLTSDYSTSFWTDSWSVSKHFILWHCTTG